MKYRAQVIDVNDPDDFGRIRARVYAFRTGLNKTPWCYPCVAFAGDGYGWFCLPEIGDQVYVEQSAEGDWIWTGGFWTQAKAVPLGGPRNLRMFVTPSGHRLSFAEGGSIYIEHSNGSMVKLESGGNIVIESTGNIHLNGSTGKVVTTECVCSYTGGPHPQGIPEVKAKGPI